MSIRTVGLSGLGPNMLLSDRRFHLLPAIANEGTCWSSLALPSSRTRRCKVVIKCISLVKTFTVEASADIIVMLAARLPGARLALHVWF